MNHFKTHPYLPPQPLREASLLCDETLPRYVWSEKRTIAGLGPNWKSQWLVNNHNHLATPNPSQSIPPISMTITSTRQPQSVLLLQAAAHRSAPSLVDMGEWAPLEHMCQVCWWLIMWTCRHEYIVLTAPPCGGCRYCSHRGAVLQCTSSVVWRPEGGGCGVKWDKCDVNAIVNRCKHSSIEGHVGTSLSLSIFLCLSIPLSSSFSYTLFLYLSLSLYLYLSLFVSLYHQ